jgi:colicin import membrane protein
MSKMVKFAVLGATVGAGYTAVQAYRRDEPMDVLASQAAKVGAEAALAGAVLGLLIGRRSKSKKAKKADRQLVGKALRTAAAAELAHDVKGRASKAGHKAARKGRRAAMKAERAAYMAAVKEGAKLSHAARAAVHSAAEATKERASDAAVAARPHVEHAARATREAALSAAETARPHVEQAARVAMDRAIDLTDQARPHVERLAESAREKAYDFTSRAIEASAAARNGDNPREIILQLV